MKVIVDVESRTQAGSCFSKNSPLDFGENVTQERWIVVSVPYLHLPDDKARCKDEQTTFKQRNASQGCSLPL